MNFNCPLCHQKNVESFLDARKATFKQAFRHKEVYSEIGKACKLCGVVLEDESKDFCSKECRGRYKKINAKEIKL